MANTIEYLEFKSPLPTGIESYSIKKPTTKNVIAAARELQTIDADSVELQLIKKYVAAYLNRGVFTDTNVNYF